MSYGCALVVTLVWLGGCAGAVAPPRSPSRTAEPGISWRIGMGPPGGYVDDICRSDRDDPCIVAASTAGSPRVAGVSVYLHPGDLRATFTGSVLIEFVDGPVGQRGYEMSVSEYRVDPGDKPPAVGSAGLVTSMPGEYEVRIALIARTAFRRDAYQISMKIPVRVVASET
jgi:hypothetical protein